MGHSGVHNKKSNKCLSKAFHMFHNCIPHVKYSDTVYPGLGTICHENDKLPFIHPCIDTSNLSALASLRQCLSHSLWSRVMLYTLGQSSSGALNQGYIYISAETCLNFHPFHSSKVASCEIKITSQRCDSRVKLWVNKVQAPVWDLTKNSKTFR